MLETIWNGIRRVAAFLTGEGDQVIIPDEPESLSVRNPRQGALHLPGCQQ